MRAALNSGASVEAVYVDAAGRLDSDVGDVIEHVRAAGTRTFELAPGVMQKVADTVNPQAVCAVVGFVDRPLAEVLAGSGEGPLVVCVDVRDPGNLGAVLRVADASGARGVLCCGTSVDPYNPKVVRASAGSIFQVPLVIEESAESAIAVVRAGGFRALAAVAHGGEDYAASDLTGQVALLFGNEASGLDEALLEGLDATVTIPIPGKAESLNVAMAAAVLCFESARQRRASTVIESTASGRISKERA